MLISTLENTISEAYNGTMNLRTLLLLILLQSCGGGTPSETIEESQDATVNSFIEIMNAHRVNVGCPALIWHAKLAGVAQDHSEDMEQNNYLSHTNQQGKSPFNRMDDNNIEYMAAGENVALNGEGAQSVFDAWMDSPDHKANIENCDYTHHGVGRAGAYWTHMFMLPN